MLTACPSCKRHFRQSEARCPFCARRASHRRHAIGKVIVAGAAGLAAMTAGLGCAYGLPEEHDAGPDAGVQDAGSDSPVDATLE